MRLIGCTGQCGVFSCLSEQARILLLCDVPQGRSTLVICRAGRPAYMYVPWFPRGGSTFPFFTGSCFQTFIKGDDQVWALPTRIPDPCLVCHPVWLWGRGTAKDVDIAVT